MFQKTIIAHFLTTIDSKIALRSLFLLLNPYFWFHMKNGKYQKICEQKLLEYLDGKDSKIVSFYNARSALYHGLKLLNPKKWDEVIVQAYTCVSVINAIIQSGFTPKYADIDDTLNIDITKIPFTENTKAIIVQHTFGNPADIEKIGDICREKHIIIIEDCAHSLGSEASRRKLGTFGDFAVFSTGRDKVISTVTGGFLVINAESYFPDIQNLRNSLKDISTLLVLRNIAYNLVTYKSRILYDFFKWGRLTLFLARKLGTIPPILTAQEKECHFTELNYRLPNALAYLWIAEIKNLPTSLHHRTQIANMYRKELSSLLNIALLPYSTSVSPNYFWFPILTDGTKKLILFCKKEKILLWDYWNGQVIVPMGSNLENCQYVRGTCPKAEQKCISILTLPTHNGVTQADAERVIKTLKNF